MVDRLSSEDRVMLWPESRWPQHVGALLVLDGSPLLSREGGLRTGDLCRFLLGRLDAVPRLRQRLVVPRGGLGGPYWVDDPEFDIARHVGVVGVPPPGDDAALLSVVEQLRRRPLDSSKPLWDMCFLTGLDGNRVGLLARVHHVIADGVAGVATLAAFLDPAPVTPATSRDSLAWQARPAPSSADLLSDAIRRRTSAAARRFQQVRPHEAPAEEGTAAPSPWRGLITGPHPPHTSLDRVVGPDRSLAVLRTSLRSVHEAAVEHEATINDVVLSVTAGGIRSLLTRRGEPTPRLPAYVPLTLRGGDEREHARGNKIANMIVALPVDIPDPAARLREVARLSAVAKRAAHPPLSDLLGNRLARWLLVTLLDRNPVSITTADLIGPREPQWLAGARVLDLFPLLPLIGSVSVGVGALSYAGRLGLLVVADADACPDLDVCAEGMRHDLAALGTDVLSQ